MTKKIDIFRKKKAWTKTPRAFIFLICQLIHEKYGSFCHEDLLNFLGAKTEEVIYFLENPEIIPIEWLIRLGETSEGNDLLAKFNSLPKRIIQDQEYCLVSGESDYQNGDDIVRRLLAEGDFYDLPENDLLAVFLDEAIEESPDPRIVPLAKRDEKIVCAPEVSSDKKYKKPISLGDNKNKGEKKNVASEAKKVVIGTKKKTRTVIRKKIVADLVEQFLAGLYRIVGLRDIGGLNRIFGAERIARFKKDKTVPLMWAEILMGYDGGRTHLERFDGILKISYKDKKKEELLKQPDEIVVPIEDFPEKDKGESVCNGDHESSIISLGEEKPDLAVVSQSNEGSEKILELKSEPLIQEESSSLETVKLTENIFVTESDDGVVESQSMPVVIESKADNQKAVYLTKGGKDKSKRSRREQNVVAQSKPDYNGYKLVPIGEVFLVLKCIKEVSKKEDADIARVLRVKAQSITYMRKGKKRMHSGHLNIMIKKFKLEPALLAKWI